MSQATTTAETSKIEDIAQEIKVYRKLVDWLKEEYPRIYKEWARSKQ